jgi:prevent-host-death family protein
MKKVSVSQFKATCLALLESVRRTGEPIVVTKRGEPLAQILPPSPRRDKTWFGCMAGTGAVRDDIVEPLDPSAWEALR